MLSDENEIALNDLLVAAKNCRDHYAQAAGISGDVQLSRLFSNLAVRRRDMADALAGILRSSGYLPAEPDPDKQSLSELATRIKAAVSPDDRKILLETAEQLETHLETALSEALQRQWPKPVLKQLLRFESRLHPDKETVASLRAGLSG